jgi:hypothetical protein
VKVSCSTAGMAEYLKRIKTLVSLSLLLPKCRTWSIYEYVAKKESKNKQRKDENERNYYKKSRGEQEKIVSRKSDENRREQEKFF